MEASAQVKSLEEANANQAAEIERLLEAQISAGDTGQADVVLKEEYAELEDDCLKYELCKCLILHINSAKSASSERPMRQQDLASLCLPCKALP